MLLNTKYHGTREYTEDDIIFFKKGLPGFEEYKNFIFFTFLNNPTFSILHSVENLTLGFVLVSPFFVREDYEFELTKEKQKELKVENEGDVIVMNTVTLNSKMENITTNLKAPIIINIKGKLGEQIILSNEKYSLKYPVFKI